MTHQDRLTAPTVGRVVHYVSYGTPGGEYPQACRAAIVTEIVPEGTIPGTAFEDVRPDTVGLCVLNPTGQFFNRKVPYDSGEGANPGSTPPDEYGQWLCRGFAYGGGTWHWPEIVKQPSSD